ncbi:MAG: hypothetical protein ACYC64_06965 [Armatimonadota bacterium]
MRTSIIVLLALAILFIAVSGVNGYTVFQDTFNQADGLDSKWDVISGAFAVGSEVYVPGGGTSNWTENLAAPKDLVVNYYTMTAKVYTDQSTQNLWAVQVHRKDANNFYRVYMDQGANTMYWQAVVNGVWVFDPPKYPVTCTNLNWSSLNMTVHVDSTHAQCTLSDGTNSYTTTLPDGEIPAGLKGDSSVVLGKTTWNPAWIGYDNVVIDNDQAWVGLDLARNATVTTSSNSAAAGLVNDSDATTGWSTTPTGTEWIKLTWANSFPLIAVAEDIEDDMPAHSIWGSSDDTTYYLIDSVPRRETGHPHRLRSTTLAAPLTVKYLKVNIGDAAGPQFGKFLSIEAYKQQGYVAGYVKFSGAGVDGAKVYATELPQAGNVHGPARRAFCGTTHPNRKAASGYYQFKVPEGNATLTAWLPDSLTVSTAQVSITAGSTTNVSDITITNRARSGATAFTDTFNSLTLGQNDSLWSNAAWVGDYWNDTVTMAYKSPAVASDISLVSSYNVLDGAVDIDRWNLTNMCFGIVTRYHSSSDYVKLQFDSWSNLGWYQGGTQIGNFTYAPIDATAVNHMHVVTVNNTSQGFVQECLEEEDTQSIYWTDKVTLTNTTTGQVGLWTSGGETDLFNDFVVTPGTAP